MRRKTPNSAARSPCRTAKVKRKGAGFAIKHDIFEAATGAK